MLHTSPEERIRLSLYKHRYTVELAGGGGGGGGVLLQCKCVRGWQRPSLDFSMFVGLIFFVGLLFFFFFFGTLGTGHHNEY